MGFSFRTQKLAAMPIPAQSKATIDAAKLLNVSLPKTLPKSRDD